ncbi:hypothetical protein [Caballeronia sp. LZ043]|uniref:hypothetical protein n=1 Tax=Caballeronia sp. LZ043 TaxID=3038569 RepID=UPI00285D5612|nr:hypothetical protein [Caballeronia sp. LZ043]MDR5826050.1 hypothetical protein [Caballeronia sp. LZ043]
MASTSRAEVEYELAKVKIEYSAGTTIVERVTLDPVTGEVHLAARVLGLLSTMAESECSPSFSLQYKGYILPIAAAVNGGYTVKIPADPAGGFRQLLDAIATPTNDQRQQNGRFLSTRSRPHRLSAQWVMRIPLHPGICRPSQAQQHLLGLG